MNNIKRFKEFNKLNENISRDSSREWKGFYFWWDDDSGLFRIMAMEEARKIYPSFKTIVISDMTKEEANILSSELSKMDPRNWEDVLKEAKYNYTYE